MIKVAFAVLILTLGVFGFSDVDLELQGMFYDSQTGSWLWDKQEPIARLFFYNGPKVALILFGICCMAALVFSGRLEWAAHRRSGLVIVLLSLAIVPSVIGLLKSATNVACPSKIEQFGGDIPHVRIFEPYLPSTKPEKVQRCFPAGHASGGYALFAIVFLCRSVTTRRNAAAFAMAVGTTMGGYKMVIGDHFLSHTLVSLELSILIVWLTSFLVFLRLPDRMDRIS